MNVFNKIIVVILLLALLALCILLALMPVETLRSLEAAMGRAALWVTALQSQQPLLYALGRVGLAVLGIVVVLPLLWQQVKPRRPKAVRVVTESGSQAAVTTDAVARRLAWHIDQLADVVSVEPTVTGGRGGVNVQAQRADPARDRRADEDGRNRGRRPARWSRSAWASNSGKIQVNIDHAPYTEGVA